ncbi:MAG: bifunctional (p)ppGpp synthetase/guanosine-3',5'-bis(diphosphate) 3'-pyrophosphohydrolase [Anaerolineae bacterium]|nr:bifunctional (p)ppGpp synthetase/guanosine-3',5'-bis(diphosphate) 3'-pyrophosphohydrolase [Anaerolineae bacterium]
MATLEDAIRLAVERHFGQRDQYGKPYILHPLRVMGRCTTDLARTVAVLHDVVEDTPLTLDDLAEAGFAPDVVEAIDQLSRREGETYEAFIERIKPHPLARAVKLADLEDNMDVRRIPQPDEEALRRLQRYRQAWEILRQEAEDSGKGTITPD